MSYQYPDKITLETQKRLHLFPENANITITMTSASVVSGHEALNTSQEIRGLVSELITQGVREDHISVEHMFIQSKTRKIFHASTAKFTIKVASIRREEVPNVLKVIASQKDIELDDIEWVYDDLDAKKSELLQQAVRTSVQEARKLCQVLGVQLLGVYTLSSKWCEPETCAFDECFTRRMRMSKSSGTQEYEIEGFDLLLNVSDYLQVTVKTDYRVSEFTNIVRDENM